MTYHTLFLTILASHLYLCLETPPSLVLEDGTANFAYFCPHRDFCTVNASQRILDTRYESCCQWCSCSSDCHETGTCCPDMFDVENKPPKYLCRDLSVFGKAGTSGAFPKRVGYSVRVIDDCPHKTLSRQYPRCTNASELTDFVLAMDVKQEKIYRNTDCALCNGVKDFIVWDLVITECDDAVVKTFASFEERNIYILKNCNILSIPPTGMEPLSNCLNRIRNVQSCTSTDALPTKYNQSLLLDLCIRGSENQNTAFFVDFDVGGGYQQSYSNVFCYLCEHGIGSIKTVCKKSYDYKDKHKFPVSFTATISFKDTLSAERNAAENCLVNEVKDLHSGQCKRFFCPAGEIPFNGSCLQAFQTSSAGIKLYFKISLLKNEEVSPIDRAVLANRIGDHVMKLIRVETMEEFFRCGLCHNLLYFHGKAVYLNLTLELAVKSSKNCPVRKILNMARQFVSTGTIYSNITIQERLYQTQFHFTSEPNFSGEETIISMVSRNFCGAVTSFTAPMLLGCPFVKLDQDRNETELKGMIKIDIERNIVGINNISYYMCVSDYLMLRATSNTPKGVVILCLYQTIILWFLK